MPLSDHEQRLLEQMERALAAEDPKLASALRGVDLRTRQRRRAVIGAAVFVVGMVLMLGGAIMMTTRQSSGFVAVSVLGFLVMLVSAYYVATSLRHMPAAGETTKVVPLRGRGQRPRGGQAKPSGQAKPKARRPKPSGTFMQRVEERWRRRRETGGY
ncbi:Protein of unknown function [Actinopolymorpha cephalotaxi]|uniref:DUF3040 domain-containing protein n=1 Tax=Actinopolymorpha cephalotaxi TaxID=504797 RepID=A0A1I2WCB1_9ACTN|nr:DUF3040 domain-containing protein [Actinopolymorpha cephalotaxi]NYH82671.1 hypothetical protein [Actinopolymorpha cephalotaxi]SFG98339.1 Protein of unknown function [Actinopolymorpha cephalotaxi]